jgi:antitoxin CptB
MGYSAAPFAVWLLFWGPMSDKTAEPLDRRRKKLKFRAWRRGFREIDLILGGFADRKLDALDEPGVVAFEALLNANDHDVYEWIAQIAAAPPEYETPTLALIRAFRFEMNQPHA